MWKGLVATVYLQAWRTAASWNPYQSWEMPQTEQVKEWNNPTGNFFRSELRHPSKELHRHFPGLLRKSVSFSRSVFLNNHSGLGFVGLFFVVVFLNKAHTVCYFLISSRHKSSPVGSDAVILSILKSSGKNMTGIFILSNTYTHIL